MSGPITDLINADARKIDARARLLEAENDKRAEKAEALVDDLENQIAEGLAGMDQAEARVAEMEGALREVMDWINNWDPRFADDDEWPDTNSRVLLALSGDGSAYADVVRAARDWRKDSRIGPTKALIKALDKMDGKETQDG